MSKPWIFMGSYLFLELERRVWFKIFASGIFQSEVTQNPENIFEKGVVFYVFQGYNLSITLFFGLKMAIFDGFR